MLTAVVASCLISTGVLSATSVVAIATQPTVEAAASAAGDDQLWLQYWRIAGTAERDYLSNDFFAEIAEQTGVEEPLLRNLYRYGLYFGGDQVWEKNILQRYPHYSGVRVRSELEALVEGGLMKEKPHFTVTRFGQLALEFLLEERRKKPGYLPDEIRQALSKVVRAFEPLIGGPSSPYFSRRQNSFRLKTARNQGDHEFDIFLDLLAARNIIAHNRFELMPQQPVISLLQSNPLSIELLDGISGGWLNSLDMCEARTAWGRSREECSIAFDHLANIGLASNDADGIYSVTRSGRKLNETAGRLAEIKFSSAFKVLSAMELSSVQAFFLATTDD